MTLSWRNGVLTDGRTNEKRLKPKLRSWPTRRKLGMKAEEALQAGIFQWLKLFAPHCIVFHIPNQGNRGSVGQQIAVAMGLMPGLHDLCLLHQESGKWIAYFMEVKTPGGSRSPVQEALHIEFTRLGIHHATITGIDDCRKALMFWNIKTRETDVV